MQFDQLKRREFVTLLGGASVAWAHAQQSAVPVIGSFSPASRETAVADRLGARAQVVT
jgi:hypothetical protein